MGAVAHGADAEGEPLPEIVVVHLGNGDVELVGDLGDEGAGDASLLLQAADAVKAEGDTTDAYVHGSSIDVGAKGNKAGAALCRGLSWNRL